VPPSIAAVDMVWQKLGGLSDREATERFTFDGRWRYPAGVGDWDEAPTGFAHTVLVDMRAHLRQSGDPKRISRVATDMAAQAGLIGLKRVLDSVPLCDAVDALARDGHAALAVLEGGELADGVAEAGELLATVIGQDIETRADGTFAIARRLAPDRVISAVDCETPNGRKTTSQRFGGYKDHVAADPDSEIITGTTAVNCGQCRRRRGGRRAAGGVRRRRRGR
jgi:hypothetical protein